MYNPELVFGVVDANALPILVLAGAAMVANYVWFFLAFRAANRDGVYSIPLICTFYWFAHDASLLARYELWFDHYGHWFMMLWWVAFIPAVLFELAFLVQAVRLVRTELFPDWSRAAVGGLLAAGVLTAGVVWEGVKYIFADDLYLLGFGLTIVSYPVFGVGLLFRRGSALGQTPGMWIAYLVTAVGYFAVSAGWFGPAFHAWQWFGLAALSVLGGVAMTFAVHRLRRDLGTGTGSPHPQRPTPPTATPAPRG